MGSEMCIRDRVLEDRLIADPAAADQVLSKFKLERTAPVEAAP